MELVNNKVFRFLIILMLFTASCNKKPKNNNQKSMNFNFPSKVQEGELIKGELDYESDLDTIKLSNDDARFIFLYVATVNKEYNSIEEIKSIRHRAFVKEQKDSSIKFECKFNKLGINYFTGIIKDEVILDNYYEDGKSRIITKETKIVYKTEVLNQKEKTL